MRRPSASAVVASCAVALAAVALVRNAKGAGTGEVYPAQPAPSAETGKLTNETPKLWFVEYPSAPLADGTGDAQVDSDDARFRQEAGSKGVSFNQRLRFKALWNGISIEAKSSTVAQIRKFASVKAVFPVQIHSLPRTTSISPELATAIQMTGADIAQTELGFTGKGVRVAVMDTGIDYDNPDLGGGFGRGKRVTTGWDFVGDTYNADPNSASYNPTPTPDPDPDDCAGHGTHVAGIIGAKGQVTGVAPGVTFGAYRVFGCEGSTSDDIMIAAMERVLKDRMDVLNMSIGDAFNNWPGSPTASAADRLVRKGVVVVASIGNSGANGLWAAGAPGVGERVIGVASFDNVKWTNRAFSVGGTLYGYDQAAAAPTAPVSGSAPLAQTGTPTTTNDGCAVLAAGSLTGKIALIRRGSCGFAVKATNAQNAGAVGVILYNNAIGRISPTVAGPTPITIPVVAITAGDGVSLSQRITAGPTTMTWTTETVSSATPTGNLISSFSSYGLAADLTLKPDIGAPGGYIWSTLPMEQGGHGSLSGTSMASPHVAGAVALLLESKPVLRRSHSGNDDDGNDESWRGSGQDEQNINRASVVRDVLQNSAEPKPWWGAPTAPYLDNVQRQGAGMLDIAGAIQATSYAYPGKLSLGEGSGATKSFLLINTARSSVTYKLSHAPALANGPSIFTPTFFDLPSTVTFAAASVTLRPGEMRQISVTVAPNADLADKSIYGGYVVVTPSIGKALHIPYVGLKGDYQSIKILEEQAALQGDSPLLLDGDLSDVAPDHGFTLTGIDQPTVIFHMDLQARRVALEVYDAQGKMLGRATEIEYMPRNSTRTGIFGLSWDGTYLAGQSGTNVVTAPNDVYTLRLTVEKPLAEKNNPAHVETWTSQAVKIARK